jgi:thiol-disulfide isomerase/thioredoxin
LYTYLSQGKTVVIDYFATWCSICWNYHNTANRLKTLYNNHGPSGAAGVVSGTTNDVMVFKVEIDQNTPTSQITFAGQNWTSGTNYPIIDLTASNNLASSYNATSQSKVFIIYPNKVVENISTNLTDAQIYAKVTNFVGITDVEENTKLKMRYAINEQGLKINSNIGADRIQIEIFDIYGKQIYKNANASLKAGDQTFVISNELKTNHIYLMKVVGEDFLISEKLIF